MAFKFIKTKDPNNDYSRVDITFEIPDNDIDLTDLLELFNDFLKACGYSTGDIVNVNDKDKND